MRKPAMTLILLAGVLTAIGGSTGHAANPPPRKVYANFAVTVQGTQRSVVVGTVPCPDPSPDGTGPDVATPFSASDVGTFATTSRVLQLSRIDHVVGVTLPHVEGYGQPNLVGHGTVNRSSNWANACDTSPDAGCGAAKLPRIQIQVQSGAIGGVSISIIKWPALPECRTLATASFPDLVVPRIIDAGVHITYSAPVPKSMLDPSKHVIVIHGVGRVTESHSDSTQTWHATTTLKYTMRLVRTRG